MCTQTHMETQKHPVTQKLKSFFLQSLNHLIISDLGRKTEGWVALEVDKEYRSHDRNRDPTEILMLNIETLQMPIHTLHLRKDHKSPNYISIQIS